MGYNKQPYFNLIRGTGIITDLVPSAGRIIDLLINGSLGGKIWTHSISKKVSRTIERINRFERILVISDLNIGDAILAQMAVSGVRDYFPGSRIDYLITSAAGPLINNPDISNLYPLFTGRPFPTGNDLIQLEMLIKENGYDLVVNFCPMFENQRSLKMSPVIDGFSVIGNRILSQGSVPGSRIHIAFQYHEFGNYSFNSFIGRSRLNGYPGIKIKVDELSLMRANDYFESYKLNKNSRPIIFFNPDGSSPFTSLPVHYQAEIIRHLIFNRCDILMSRGFSKKGVEAEIMNLLPPACEKSILIVPYILSLSDIAAYVDRCDAYIGSDTGALHIAAARKSFLSRKFSPRNKTSIISIFGATPARIYGYDSVKSGYLPANQESVSTVFESAGKCINITCADKKNKSCKTIKCFENLNPEETATDILSLLAVAS